MGKPSNLTRAVEFLGRIAVSLEAQAHLMVRDVEHREKLRIESIGLQREANARDEEYMKRQADAASVAVENQAQMMRQQSEHIKQCNQRFGIMAQSKEMVQ